MVTLKLTNSDVDEILHALRSCYVDYNDKLDDYYNRAMESYNNQLDGIITKIKEQVKEQEV